MLVERLHAHRPHALGNQVADRIVDHGACDAGVHPKAVGQVGGDVEFAAAHVNLAFVGFAERNDPGVQTMDQRAQRDRKSSAPSLRKFNPLFIQFLSSY